MPDFSATQMENDNSSVLSSKFSSFGFKSMKEFYPDTTGMEG